MPTANGRAIINQAFIYDTQWGTPTNPKSQQTCGNACAILHFMVAPLRMPHAAASHSLAVEFLYTKLMRDCRFSNSIAIFTSKLFVCYCFLGSRFSVLISRFSFFTLCEYFVFNSFLSAKVAVSA